MNFNPTYILTSQNDPMGRDNGVYLKAVSVFGSAMLIRLDLIDTRDTDDMDLTDIEALTSLTVRNSQSRERQYTVYSGGNTDQDEILLLHSLPDISGSINIHLKILNLTDAKSLVAALPKDTALVTAKILRGHTLITETEILEKTKSRDWLVVNASSIFAFSNAPDLLFDMLKRSGKKATVPGSSKLRNFMRLIGNLRELLSTLTEPQVALIRASLYPIVSREVGLSRSKIEDVLDAMLHIHASDTNGALENALLTKEGELPLLPKRLSIFRLIREARIPFLKLNKTNRKICDTLKIDRYQYDLSVTYAFLEKALAKQNSKTATGNEKRTLDLYNRLCEITEIAKAQGR